VKNVGAFTSSRFVKDLLIICTMIIGPVSNLFSQEYFQQEVNYIINVTLNDRQHELDACETVEYINNSTDTLGFLFFHLWPNSYSDNQTSLAEQLLILNGKERLFNDPELQGYIDLLDFKVDGQTIQWDLMPGEPDICRIILNKSLCQGDTILITTPFHIKIPKGITSRLGHIGESYQISQWYPKPAVYDKNGWHQMPYLDQGEYYSEFGSFDVSITLPANYTVGATGNLQNPTETERLDELAADTAWMSSSSRTQDSFPASSEQMKTLRYTGNKIHDFAWFADKRYHVMKSKVRLPASGREVITWVMFTDQQADLWKNALKYSDTAILLLSDWIGDYPYDQFTAVQSALTAGAGMEYPGITVIGLVDDAYALDQVIAHEACHNWFYSALGSDERRFPFMDEGITSAYEIRYMDDRYPGKKLWELFFKNRRMARFFQVDKMSATRLVELEWMMQARNNLEQAANLAAPGYSMENYAAIIYNKTAIGFNYLRAYLGDSIFDAAMQEYYSTWKSKHPQPDDLRDIFESLTGKDLTWFFTDFLGTTKRMDYKVVRLKDDQLLIKNKGEMASPLVISGMNGDSISSEKWSEGFKGRKWVDTPPGNISEIKIDPMHVMPELYRLNNNIHTSGIFRKADPTRFQLLYSIDDPDVRTLVYIPVVNWTRENGFMMGVSLSSGTLLPKPVEFLMMPFYTMKDHGLAGFGRIRFNMTPYDHLIRMATFTLEGTQFGAPGDQNYHKVLAGIDLHFRTIKMNDPVLQNLYGRYIATSDLYQIEIPEKAKMNSFLQFGYFMERRSLANPFSLLTSFESGKSHEKVSVDINYRYSYYGKNSGLDIRLFAGIMMKSTPAIPFHSLAASGRSGREDFLFQEMFPDRFSVFPETFWSRQMDLSEGGLVSPVNDSLGYYNWLVSLSFTSNLPGKLSRIPVKPFVNILLNHHDIGTGSQSPFFYEAGLKAGIWKLFEIYVPLLVSENIRTIRGSFKDRIRFVLNLDTFYRIRL
jgi:hypothetical protein